MSSTESHQAIPVSVPIAGDALQASVPRATQNLTIDAYNAHDADAGIHFNSGLLSARPDASALPNGQYFATDDQQMFFSDGVTWIPWNYTDGSPVPNQADMMFLATICR